MHGYARRWPILDEAVGGGRPYALAALACPDPYTVAQRHRPAYGRLVARACLDPDAQEHDLADVRAAALAVTLVAE